MHYEKWTNYTAMEINKTEQSRHKNMIHTYDLRL